MTRLLFGHREPRVGDGSFQRDLKTVDLPVAFVSAFQSLGGGERGLHFLHIFFVFLCIFLAHFLHNFCAFLCKKFSQAGYRIPPP